MWNMHSRRRFLAGATIVGAAGLIGSPKSLHAEPPPETTTVRLPKFFNATCLAPEYAAEELLRADGFTDVRWVEKGTGPPSDWLAHGDTDFDYAFPPAHIHWIDAGAPITVLTGVHSGCLELIANDRIHNIADLKGKRVGVYVLTSAPHLTLMIMLAYVGVDPTNDIHWVTDPDYNPVNFLAEGKIDAFMGFPTEPQETRARKIGHTILSTSLDLPWSQYFCCMLASSTDYVTRYPVATKRVIRAILKSTDLCVSKPQWVARRLVDGGFTDNYDYALQTMNDVRFGTWRELDAEDTIRFYALRMHELGMIKSSPQKIIADGTDWRFVDELKRELKT